LCPPSDAQRAQEGPRPFHRGPPKEGAHEGRPYKLTRCSSWPLRLPTPWMPPTRRASSIAISSPRTSSSPHGDTPRFSTLAWRRLRLPSPPAPLPQAGEGRKGRTIFSPLPKREGGPEGRVREKPRLRRLSRNT